MFHIIKIKKKTLISCADLNLQGCKHKHNPMNYLMSESSDDETTIDPKSQLCTIITDNTILSNDSHEYPIKFYEGSFALKCKGDVMIVELNQMFIWRLLFSAKTLTDDLIEFDFQRLKLYILRMENRISLRFTNNKVCYKLNGISVCKFSNDDIFNCYNRLYVAIKRKYDLTDHINELFDYLITIFRFISS
jgi:hypothetical protein